MHLLAFPFFAVTAYQLTVSRFDDRAAALQSVNQETLDQIAGMIDLLDAGLSLSSSLGRQTTLERAVRGACTVLDSELCAIALLGPGTEEAELEIAVRNAELEHPGRRFQVSRYAVMQRALAQGTPVVSGPQGGQSTSEVHELLANRRGGPLILQPLAHETETIGVLFASRPHSLAPYTAPQIHRCERLARFIAVALINARLHAGAESQIEEQKGNVRALERALSRTRADLENRLKQAGEEVTVYVQKLYEAEVAEQRAQADARELRQQLRDLGQGDGSALEAQPAADEDAAEAALLRKRAATLETAREQLQRQVSDLEQERRDLRTKLSELESANVDLAARVPSPQQVHAAQVLHAMPHGIIIADAQGTIVRVNPAAARRLDLRSEV
jgi:PAS domain-containing protein